MFLSKTKAVKRTADVVTEIQAVILAGRPRDWGNLDAVTDDGDAKAEHKIPKAALPVAGKPMIHYQLEWLEAARIQEVLVLCSSGSKNEIQSQLQKYAGSSDMIKFKVMTTNHGEGTADALRQVKDEIKSDFIVMTCDVITDLPPHHLIDLHRIHGPAVTALMYDVSKLDSKTPGSKRDEYAEYIGIDTEKGNLVFAEPQDSGRDTVRFQIPMLRRFPRLRMYTNLRDAHVYIFKRWVIDIVVKETSISSIRKDLLRALLRCQHSKRTRQALNIDALIRANPDPFAEAAILSTTSCQGTDAMFKMAQEKASESHNPTPRESVTDSPKPEEDASEQEFICAAVICEDSFCARANNVSAYAEVNRQRLAIVKAKAAAGDTKGKPPQVGSDSIIESESIGERCSIKKSVIGRHCTIGKNVKITNSVIMDHVVIEDFVKLDGCIVSMNAQILEQSQLKDCEVAPMRVVEKGTVKSNEQFVSHFLDMDEA
ncbi:hypothetical protein HKX48_007571 [Thoreauomyces humboldtii]|nr:hypothetical protein HKX48_007571 [Thoreauomyces humboldtii]